jgi:hypothetical protein
MSDEGAESTGGNDSFLSLFASGAWSVATKGPRKALDLAQRGLTEAERLALTTLRKRMEAVSDEGDFEDRAPSGHDENPAPARSQASSPARAPAQTASEALAQLMEASLEQTETSAREALLLRIIRQLVPDEARILAALADGHASALMHLGAGPMVGPATQRWLENLSPVGKEAGVQLVDQTSAYISHLRELGLLESGDEDKSLQLKYQLMEGDTKVRKTAEEIEKSGLRPKFFRRTLVMSEAGRAFWAACEPKDRQSW